MIRARSLLAWTAVAALAGLASALGGQMSSGSAHTLIPAPVSVELPGGGDFVLSADTVIGVTPGDEHAAWVGRYLSDFIGLAAGAAPPRVDAAAAPAAGMIHLGIGPVEGGGDEGYQLTVSADRIVVTANHAAGLFYGVQTLRQLLPAFVESEGYRADEARPVRVAAVRIVDRPRFAWRGAMLDVARHFFSVDEIKRYLDLVSAYKLNRLHLHLADDQGWRIEIKSWANLTAVAGATEVGGGRGGFYTQAQYADIVSYARDRFITIVPEIDMPGHTNAALAAYAELNCDGVARPLYTGIEVGFSNLCVDKDITYKFIDDVVGEIAGMTPGPYFHIGGDEVKTLTEKQYRTFIERVQGIVQSHGKQMIGWDEIAPIDLLPTTLVQHWRPDGSPTAAVAKGAKVIMSVANRAYLDMKYDANTPLGLNWAGFIDVRTAYDWDPATVVPGISEASILGVEAPIWTETLANMRDVEFMAFPRLPGVAEVAWSPAGRDWEQFRRRLAAQAPHWTALGVNFYRSPSVAWPQ
jgi:hexosaminidase